MFLEKLSEHEKEAFLDLARATAKADGMVEDAEKTMIQRYCREMCMDEHKIYEVKTVDQATEYFSKASSKVQNIVIYELLMLCNSDKDVEKEEKVFIADLAGKIGLSGETFDTLKKDVKAYRSLVHDIKKHIKGKEE